MPATAKKLEPLEHTFLCALNMMEIIWKDKVYILDLDTEMGNVALYGHPHDTRIFREELGKVMDSAFKKYSFYESWQGC